MAGELSDACFWDLCRDCQWAACTCKCHRDQVWDWGDGWRDRDDEEDGA